MSVTINTTVPTDGEQVSAGASRIRELKVQLLGLIGQIFKNDGTNDFLPKWITQAMLGDTIVGTGQVADKAISVAKLGSDSTNGKQLRGKVDGSVEWFIPPAIATNLANPDAGGADDGKVLVVDSGAAKTFKYVDKTTLQTVLQMTSKEDGTWGSSSTSYSSAATPTTANGSPYSALDTTATSKGSGFFHVDVLVYLSNGAGAGAALVASLFDSVVSATNAVAVGVAASQGTVVGMMPVILRYKVATGGAGVARTFKVYFGGTTGTTFLNGNNSTALFGGKIFSQLRVTEVA